MRRARRAGDVSHRDVDLSESEKCFRRSDADRRRGHRFSEIENHPRACGTSAVRGDGAVSRAAACECPSRNFGHSAEIAAALFPAHRGARAQDAVGNGLAVAGRRVAEKECRRLSRARTRRSCREKNSLRKCSGDFQSMSDIDISEAIEQGRDSRLNAIVATMVALTATFMALCNVKDGNIGQGMAQAQASVVDTWSYFQAKSTKQSLAE